jgi:membrane protein YqaA with SNARE-associated domain
MSAWLDEWPLLGLFFSAFISSTLLPGGSEALLLWQLKRGQDPYLLLSVATVGNVAGSLLTLCAWRRDGCVFPSGLVWC